MIGDFLTKISHNNFPLKATLNQMLSAIFSRMENKTLEIEEMEKSEAEAKVV